MPALEISIVIPAYNEAKNIVRCLTSIFEQETHNVVFEVIIVDDCSTDNSPAVIDMFSSSRNIDEIRVLRNPVNKGRFETRLKGINASKYELILLIDSKVTLAKDAFNKLCQINYSPLIATNTVPTQQNLIERTYYLIRKKAYRGNYPKMKLDSVMLTLENFDTLPKGTTTFLCEKATLLGNLPMNTDKNSSDDTAWLNLITIAKPIMIHNEFEFTYHPREENREILKHLYQRGPKFIDYYYHSGTFYYNLINTAIGLALFILTLLLLGNNFWCLALAIAFVVILSISAYLAEGLTDVVKLCATLPLLIGTFGMGALYGLYLKWCRNQHSLDER